jgi:hypothetical protein
VYSAIGTARRRERYITPKAKAKKYAAVSLGNADQFSKLGLIGNEYTACTIVGSKNGRTRNGAMKATVRAATIDSTAPIKIAIRDRGGLAVAEE